MINFQSYEEIRKEILATEKAREDLQDESYRSGLINKVSGILQRMAAQEKFQDFIDFPWNGPLAGGTLLSPKEEARRAKIASEIQEALALKGWVIIEPSIKGFGIKRK